MSWRTRSPRSLRTKVVLPLVVLGLGLGAVDAWVASVSTAGRLVNEAGSSLVGWLMANVAVAGLVVYLLLQRLVLRPLAAIRGAMDRRAAGDTAARAPSLSSDEIGSLA